MKFRAWIIALIGLASVFAAAAQEYPDRPIHLIVPFPPGGGIDGVARMIQQEFGKALGQTIVVENRVGAGGRVGGSRVAKAAPDGYTLLMVFDSHAVDGLINKDMPYDPLEDLTPVSLMVTAPLLAVVPKDLPVDDIPALLAYAKANPKAVTFGSSGVGSSQHLVGELFAMETRTAMTHIPYKGGAEGMKDLLGGRLALMWFSPPSAQQLVRTGRAKLLGLAAETRMDLFPDLKTVSEQGVAGFTASAWIGMVAPAKTPPETVRRIHAALLKATSQPSVAAEIKARGYTPMMSTPAEFGTFLRAENAKWAHLIKEAGIPLQ